MQRNKRGLFFITILLMNPSFDRICKQQSFNSAHAWSSTRGRIQFAVLTATRWDRSWLEALMDQRLSTKRHVSSNRVVWTPCTGLRIKLQLWSDEMVSVTETQHAARMSANGVPDAAIQPPPSPPSSGGVGAEIQRHDAPHSSPLSSQARAEPRPNESTTESALAPEETRGLVHVLKLFADETRIKILSELLQAGEANVQTLCRKLGQTQPAVSHHLALLKEAKMVEMRRSGKHNFYRVCCSPRERVLDAMAPLFAIQGPSN